MVKIMNPAVFAIKAKGSFPNIFCKEKNVFQKTKSVEAKVLMSKREGAHSIFTPLSLFFLCNLKHCPNKSRMRLHYELKALRKFFSKIFKTHISYKIYCQLQSYESSFQSFSFLA